MAMSFGLDVSFNNIVIEKNMGERRGRQQYESLYNNEKFAGNSLLVLH
jgi:hypothetical protein